MIDCLSEVCIVVSIVFRYALFMLFSVIVGCGLKLVFLGQLSRVFLMFV